MGALSGLRASPLKAEHANWRWKHKEESFVYKFVIWIFDLSTKSKNIEVRQKLMFLAFFGQVGRPFALMIWLKDHRKAWETRQKGQNILISILYFLLFTQFSSVVEKL